MIPDLGDDYDRLSSIPVLEQLQDGQPHVMVQWLQAEVVQDDHALALQVVQQLDEGSVEPCERHLLDEAVHVEVCCLVPEGAGEEALPAAGGSHDEYVLSVVEVLPLEQESQLLLGEVPCGP